MKDSDYSGNATLTRIVQQVVADYLPNSGADTISGFCRRHRISRSKFYTLPEDQRPEITNFDGCQRITAEAEMAWRQRMTERTRQKRPTVM